MNGISKLTDAAFEYLSNAQVSLELDGIRELSDSAANSLSKHEGGLSLLSLYEISDFAASVSPGTKTEVGH